MKKQKFALQPDSKRLLELRRREEEIAAKPSAECYLKLADEYQELGLSKESDRLLQLAEALENGSDKPHDHHDNSKGLMSGAANTVMITEVIQILNRTMLTGDLTIDAKTQVFHLYFDKGQIINASSELYPQGMKSFCMALRVTSGTYRFAERPVDKIERLIEGNTEVLLLNAMYDKDQELSQNSSK